MVTIANIGWSSYDDNEGPFYYGSNYYKIPEKEISFNDKCYAVIASSEGTLSSINMYDRAIISVGAIQWTELTNNKVSEMIGLVATRLGVDFVLNHIQPALTLSGGTFKQNAAGDFRFFIDEKEVKGESLARKLFAGGSNKKGSWTKTNITLAKTWAMCVANLFYEPEAAEVQIEFTAPQLRGFVYGEASKIFFEKDSPETGLGGAVKAIVVAYAINLPAVACSVAARSAKASKYPKWSDEWCLDVMHGLAVTSGVKIWPARYNAKRPVLERLFNIVLPKDANSISSLSWRKTPPTQVKPVVLVPKPVPVAVAPKPQEKLPEPVVVIPEQDQRPANITEHPATELVLIRPDGAAVKPESPMMALLQWMPMMLGFWGHFINWLIHLVRGK